jgi:broad specificity phosphatase PhoE
MKIILARHGNTFVSGEAAVWIGAGQDLPLVDSGIQQAKNLAKAIQQSAIDIKAIFCGPLKRTSDYATVIVKTLDSSLKPIIDSRLNEIDYGNWSGLSNTEIQARGSGDELTAWENFSIWPKAAAWSGSPKFLCEEIKAFADAVLKKYEPSDTILVITSNGRLRYFLQLIPFAFEQAIKNKKFKVATGNICLLSYTKAWQLEFWNEKPEFLFSAGFSSK